MPSKIKNDGTDGNQLDRKIGEKFSRLAARGFNQATCYEFFGSLNRDEISRLIELLSTKTFIMMSPETREFIFNYLKKLEAAVAVKQKNI